MRKFISEISKRRGIFILVVSIVILICLMYSTTPPGMQASNVPQATPDSADGETDSNIPNEIIGDDDRSQVGDVSIRPYRMIVKLTIDYPNSQDNGCTGWMAGPHTIVTSAHCIYNPDKGGWAERVDYYFERDGELNRFADSVPNPSQCSSSVSSCGPLRKAAAFSGGDDDPLDYGAVILTSDKEGHLEGWMVAETVSDTTLEGGRIYTLSGYPGDKPFGTQWWDFDYAQQISGSWSADYLHYVIDTFSGQSGSALLYLNSNEYYSNGIHKGCGEKDWLGYCTLNRAVRITASVLSDLRSWGAEESPQVCWELTPTVVNGTGPITQTIQTGYECNGEVDYFYVNASIVDLTVISEAGKSIIWDGTDDDSLTGTTNQVTMNAYKPVTATYLGIPINIIASDGDHTNKIEVVWDGVVGANFYEIYRATSSGGTKTMIASQANTDLNDYDPVPGKKYYYWVKACINAGCTDFSTDDSGWKALLPPLNVDASDGNYSDKVHLTWTASDGQDPFYEIDRAESIGGTRTEIDITGSTFYHDTTAVAGTIYYYWIRACTVLGCSVDSSYTTGWKNLEPPDSVLASDGAYTTKVQVSWSIVTGADNYQVKRSTTIDGTKDHLSSPSTTPYDDTSAAVGQAYFYWVEACTSPGCSSYSDHDTGWRNISPPGFIQASNGTYTNKVQVSWNPSDGATNYEIYRAESSDGIKTKLDDEGSTTYDDTTAVFGTIYYYWVKACHTLDCSDFSDYDMGWRTGIAPPAPTNVQASDGTYTDKVGVTWTATADTTYYEVHRSDTEGGTKTLLENPTGTSHDDTSAVVSITYYYWVIACNTYGCSTFDDYDTGWRDGSAPAAPDNISASDGAFSNKVAVNWTSSTGATYYEIYRSDTEGGAKTPLGSPTGTSHDDTSAAVSTTYYYWVKACNTYGCSGVSDYNTGWRDAPGSAPTKPTNIYASDGLFTDKVYLDWDESPETVNYEVWRGITTKIGSPSVPVFEDTAAVIGTIYTYYILACNEYGCSGFTSGGDDYGYRMAAPPTNVQASDGTYTDKVQVTWDASAGATKYHVLREPGGLVGMNIAGTSFDDTSAVVGVIYDYSVYPCVTAGCGGDPSTSNSGWRSDLPPGVPTGVTASYGTYTDKVHITWNSVTGADYYEVYRTNYFPQEPYDYLGSTTGTAYDDFSPIATQLYNFCIKACNAYDCSDYSSLDLGYRAYSIPDPPTDVQATDGTHTDKVMITWSDPPRGDNFEVYRAESEGGTKTLLVDTTDLYHEDTSALPGVLYYYWVRAGNYIGMGSFSDYDQGWRGGSGSTASLPFYDDFESGSLGLNWGTYKTEEGRVQVSTSYPYTGTYSLLLDDQVDGGATSTSAVILPVDLSGVFGVELTFWWREFSDENNPEDGVFIRDVVAGTWCQAMSFNNGPTTFSKAVIDLHAAAETCGMNLTSDFQIKFQFYDNYAITTDGYAIDNVSVYRTGQMVFLPLVAAISQASFEDVQVNDDTSTGVQIRPDYAIAPYGTLYAVWEDYRNGTYADAGDIYFSYSTDGGATWSEDIRVNDDIAAGARRRFPKIATSPSGDAYVVWVDWRNDANPTTPNDTPESTRDPDIYLAKWPSGGSSFQSNVLVYPDSNPDIQDSPDVVVDADGNIYVAFYDRTSDIHYGNSVVSKSTNGGTSFIAPVAADNHTSWALGPRLAIDRTNDVLYLVFQGHPSYYKPFFTRSTDGGDTWSNDVQLDAGPDRDWYDAAWDISVAADNYGHVIVIWADERNDPDNGYSGDPNYHDESDIYANYSTDGGATWLTTQNIIINDDSTYKSIRNPQASGIHRQLLHPTAT